MACLLLGGMMVWVLYAPEDGSPERCIEGWIPFQMRWDLPEELRKPNDYALKVIMETYGFSPQELLVVDDMKLAYTMAKKQGVPIAFAAWGRKNCPAICEEMRRLCDFSFDTPQEFGNFLFG